MINDSGKTDTLLEIWFYRFAHYYDKFPDAETKIQQLLDEGIRSVGWNLEGNVSKAIADGHPEPEKLKELAKQITEI